MFGIERERRLDVGHRSVEVVCPKTLRCGVKLILDLAGNPPRALRVRLLCFSFGNERQKVCRAGIALLKRSQYSECRGEVTPGQRGLRLVERGSHSSLSL